MPYMTVNGKETKLVGQSAWIIAFTTIFSVLFAYAVKYGTILVVAFLVFNYFDKTKMIEQNLKNECLEYQHTEDDLVVCIKRLSEEQINQILNR